MKIVFILLAILIAQTTYTRVYDKNGRQIGGTKTERGKTYYYDRSGKILATETQQKPSSIRTRMELEKRISDAKTKGLIKPKLPLRR